MVVLNNSNLWIQNGQFWTLTTRVQRVFFFLSATQ